jgi:ABC-type branched-subunit amino acid transport system permease subunit
LVIGSFNLFHLLMIGLGAYAIVWIARNRGSPSRAGP